MTNTPTPKHVFMSYSRRDEAVMRRVVGFLREQGINVWVDNEKLVPGTPIWEEEIEKAIISAGAIVVLLSPDSKKSPWVRREISYAEDNGKRIFPVLVAGDEKNAIPIRLTNYQRIDLRQNEEASLNSLSIAISFYLEDLAAHKLREKKDEEKIRKETNGNKFYEKTEESVTTKEAISYKTDLVSLASKGKVPFYLSWKGRSILGGIIGLLTWIIFYYAEEFIFRFLDIFLFVFGGILGGLIIWALPFFKG